MPSITIQNVPDDVHRALEARAARNGRSAESEIREILERAVKPERRVRLGDELSSLGRRIGLTNADLDAIERARVSEPAAPRELE